MISHSSSFERERERKGGVLGVCRSALVWVRVRRAMAFPDASSDLLLPICSTHRVFPPHGKQKKKKGQRQSPLSQTSQLQIFLSLFFSSSLPSFFCGFRRRGREQQFLPLPQREGRRVADGRREEEEEENLFFSVLFFPSSVACKKEERRKEERRERLRRGLLHSPLPVNGGEEEEGGGRRETPFTGSLKSFGIYCQKSSIAENAITSSVFGRNLFLNFFCSSPVNCCSFLL